MQIYRDIKRQILHKNLQTSSVTTAMARLRCSRSTVMEAVYIWVDSLPTLTLDTQ